MFPSVFIEESIDFHNKKTEENKTCEMSQAQKDKCFLQYVNLNCQLSYTYMYREVRAGKYKGIHEMEKKSVFHIG